MSFWTPGGRFYLGRWSRDEERLARRLSDEYLSFANVQCEFSPWSNAGPGRYLHRTQARGGARWQRRRLLEAPDREDRLL